MSDNCRIAADSIIKDNAANDALMGTNVVENTPIATAMLVITRRIFIVEHMDSVGM
jgi:hypothetical protein